MLIGDTFSGSLQTSAVVAVVNVSCAGGRPGHAMTVLSMTDINDSQSSCCGCCCWRHDVIYDAV